MTKRDITPESRAYDQGRYRILERIRSSAHATLYRVYDEEAGEQLALKVLNRQYPDSSIVKAMFDKEVESLTRFRHLIPDSTVRSRPERLLGCALRIHNARGGSPHARARSRSRAQRL